MTNIEKIRKIIYEEVLENELLTDITDKTSLLDEVGLDSIQLLQLIASLEQEFDICFSGTELVLADFDTINSIVNLIERKVNDKT